MKAIKKGEIIDDAEALEYAKKWVKEYKIYEMKPYRFLKDSGFFKPMLVNKDYGGYYLILYGLERTSKELAIGAIIIKLIIGI